VNFSIKIISLGGSIIVPDKIDTEFIKEFTLIIQKHLTEESNRKVIIVCGGGGPARAYQKAYREALQMPNKDAQDWIGIAATRLNAELMRHVFSGYCVSPVITNPTSVGDFPGRILVASGWKPGFSTDFDAVLLAERFKADYVINLSNIPKVYTDDPKSNPDASPIDNISWSDFIQIVGEDWVPGKNAPFDPVAAKYAAKIHLKVIVASGHELSNFSNILNNQDFEGTVIGPE
jgi:uridylate kinase